MNSTDFHSENSGIQIGHSHAPITAEFYQSYTSDDIDRICLQHLHCPDSLAVKNRLKEAKDKLLRQSFEWVLQDPQYRSWRDGNDVCLLWIKGGAGKGKTMMSIGLIEELSRERDPSTLITYFFCQNADNDLNNLESLIKGLILRLVNQRVELKESLRRRWDPKNDRFSEDVTLWRALWNMLLEMLDLCHAFRIYIIVDALDECQDSGMGDFLKLLVRTGLDSPFRIKWLLTSRPLEAAERALLAGHDQLQVSLELNSQYVSQSVQSYISYKVDELSRQNRYKEVLARQVKDNLFVKAEGTFLWVSLVCKTLEGVHPDSVLVMIQGLPPGLHPFYDRILHQLNNSEPHIARQHMRLLKAMTLAYRPLKVQEVPSVTGLTSEDDIIEVLVDRCASFIKMQGNTIQFVHQSARDYLASDQALSILDLYESFGHYDVVLGCLTHLSKQLRVNLIELPRPDSTRESWESQKDKNLSDELSSLAYAAIFWVQHLQNVQAGDIARGTLIREGPVGMFLQTKMLEWLECLSLLDRLSGAIQSFQELLKVCQEIPSTSALLQDASRFLQRHYYTVSHWPLQLYSSALIFSPESSVIKAGNRDKIPEFIQKAPIIENAWASLLQTLVGHSASVHTVAFSPDGKQIASGSDDRTIKLWDTATGGLCKTLEGHSGRVGAMAISPSGKQIASGSADRTIKLWDTTTGDLQKILEGHSGPVSAVAFSPSGNQIASGSDDRTIKLWDTITGDLQKTLEGHSGPVSAVAFSPSGKQIASGSDDRTIKLWDTTTGDLQKTLVGHSSWVNTVAFSPDSKQIVSGSWDKTIKLWDTTTGALQKTLEGHSGPVSAVAFSPSGKQIASGSADSTIKLWDTTTGDLQKTLEGHSRPVSAVAFSPSGKQIASGSWDSTIKLWDTTTGDLQKTLEGHSGPVSAVAFSPSGKQIASGSADSTIKLWDTTTGDLQKTLEGHSGRVSAVAFSPDSKQIVSGSWDKTIKLWDTTTGALQKTLEGHSGPVSAVAFSPDSKQISSGPQNKFSRMSEVAKFFKDSKSLGPRFATRVKPGSHKETQMLGPVGGLTLSANAQSCIVDAQELSVQGRWIYYGTVAFLRLSLDTQPRCYAVRGDWVAIGLSDGQVWRFAIDRRALHSMLEPSQF
ncbi:G-protein beta WD- 40 repeats containing protein [Penicillium macrosclerotiorum]|uniref:G-protein beta WD- 40 repeats containing protein n=1 Tax=Penicillium macrosclerotiorum TaxID=303699 RepID=UPI002547A578|nr:G-protein beta WD- 40 repeats containing protein [Penicillium macrosclerotiorum]KAJ5698118.1 G-protein beta WD- 40 repeats containing protein [Penicillium macrosclerotiorum]